MCKGLMSLKKDIQVFGNLSRKRRRKVTRCLCSYLEVRLTGIGTGSDMEKDFMINIYIKHQQYRTLALAFEFQVVDSIPTDSYDIRPDGIITEETYYV